MRTRLLALLLLASTTACGFPKTGPAPGAVNAQQTTAAEQRWPGTTAAELEAGRKLFLDGCDSCHGYPELQAIPEARWADVMREMGPKADLTPEQSEQVLRFVLIAR